jgi:putative phosphoribosyl transferase
MSVSTAETTRQARIMIGEGMWLDADVTVPASAIGVVLFAHGSGSGRSSPRNQFVAGHLNAQHLTTVLADLLTSNEARVDEHTLGLRFDIPLLARRVERIIEWTRDDGELSALAIGLFGASTGAAAALDAAALRPDVVRAVVSRGGRPDLASKLDRVKGPTLLIVGGNDTDVLRMNESALRKMKCPKRLEVVPGATHLFEEPEMLERVAALAGSWFSQHLQPTIVRP